MHICVFIQQIMSLALLFHTNTHMQTNTLITLFFFFTPFLRAGVKICLKKRISSIYGIVSISFQGTNLQQGHPRVLFFQHGVMVTTSTLKVNLKWKFTLSLTKGMDKPLCLIKVYIRACKKIDPVMYLHQKKRRVKLRSASKGK